MSRAALGLASVVALLVVASGASVSAVSAASAAGPVLLPGCGDLLDPVELRLATGGDRVKTKTKAGDTGRRICNWVLTKGATAVLLDLDAVWVDPTTESGNDNLEWLGSGMCKGGPKAACDARGDLTSAKTANAAFRVLYRWWNDLDLAAFPYRMGSDLAFWTGYQGKSDLWLLVAGGRAGVLLHAACARVEKDNAQVPYAACTQEAMRFARANLRSSLKLR